MANSDWASEAFGPLKPVSRIPALIEEWEIEEALKAQVGDLITEAEFVLKVIDTNECRACENWFYGDGLQCEEHGEEADVLKARRDGLL